MVIFLYKLIQFIILFYSPCKHWQNMGHNFFLKFFKIFFLISFRESAARLFQFVSILRVASLFKNALLHMYLNP